VISDLEQRVLIYEVSATGRARRNNKYHVIFLTRGPAKQLKEKEVGKDDGKEQ
jgi:hypothetical protein